MIRNPNVRTVRRSEFTRPVLRQATPQRAHFAKDSDSGFTLVELLIVMVIIPLILGAISVALLATFRVQSGISDRLTTAGDTQVVSANYFGDIQSATEIYAPTSTGAAVYPQCGTTSPILSLQWYQTSGNLTFVSYSVSANGKSPSGTAWYKLTRSVCTVSPSTLGSSPTTPDATTILAENVPSDLTAYISCLPTTTTTTTTASASCPVAVQAAQSGWESTAGMESVTLKSSLWGTTSSSNYEFLVGAAPRISTSASGSASTKLPNVPPLELLGTGNLNMCNSGSNIYINGPAQFSGTVSGKKNSQQEIDTPAVYSTQSTPPSTLYKSPTPPTYPPFTHVSSTYDPLQNLPVPVMSQIALAPAPINGVYQPGKYDVGLTPINNNTIQLASGNYYFEGTANTDVRTATIVGTGVMLYFTDTATINFDAGAVVQLSPSTSLPYKGVTIWQNGAAATNPQILVDGSSDTSGLSGVVYIPNGNLALSGTPNFYASNLVTQDITCNGGGNGNIMLGYTYVPNNALRPSLTWTYAPPSSTPKNSMIAIEPPGYVKTTGQTVIEATPAPLNSGTNLTYSLDVTSNSGCQLSYDPTTGTGSVTYPTTSKSSCVVDVNQTGAGGYFAPYELQGTTTTP